MEDDFADFASAAPDAPLPLSPGSAARDGPLPEHDFAEPTRAAEHGTLHGFGASIEPAPAGDAFAIVSAAAEAQSEGTSGAGAIDLSHLAEQLDSMQPGTAAVIEPIVLSTSAAEPDAFAAFSPARVSTMGAGAADWAAEEGFGDFATATEERDVAVELAVAGVAVSPRVVVRDWCEHTFMSASTAR